MYWEKQDPWESAFLPNPQAMPVLLTWEYFLSVDDIETTGRERTVLALQWEEGIIVLVGSGLLVAALARLPGRRLAGSRSWNTLDLLNHTKDLDFTLWAMRNH